MAAIAAVIVDYVLFYGKYALQCILNITYITNIMLRGKVAFSSDEKVSGQYDRSNYFLHFRISISW